MVGRLIRNRGEDHLTQLIVIYIVVYALHGIWQPLYLLENVILLTLISFTILKYTKSPSLKINRTRMNIILIASSFVISMFVLGVIAPYYPDTTRYITPVFGGFALFFIIQLQIKSQNDIELLLDTIAIMSTFISLLGILNFFGAPIPSSVGGLTSGGIPKSLFGISVTRYGPVGIPNPDGFVIFIMTGSLIWVRRLIIYDIELLDKARSIIMFTICSIGVIISVSRLAWIGATTGILLMIEGILFKSNGNKKSILGITIALTYLVASIIALYILVWMALNLYSERFLQYLSMGVPRSVVANLHNRFGIWEKGLGLFLREPLTGMGIGAFPNITGISNAHNTYVSLLANNGGIVFSIFILFLMYIVLLLFRGASSDDIVTSYTSLSFLSSMAVLIISMNSFVITYAASTTLWLVLSLGGLNFPIVED